jgi:hypothetical protein
MKKKQVIEERANTLLHSKNFQFSEESILASLNHKARVQRDKRRTKRKIAHASKVRNRK